MWLKLCLLLIYITVLFILARLLEAISWYETGSLSKRLLDPMTLSVLKLKALLEQRGVSFEGVVLEKSDLTELVEGSGPVTDDEVDAATWDIGEDGAVTNFTSGAHFFEQVEDAKDSVWLIQMYASHRSAILLGDSRWKAIRNKVSRFGVRAGILDCSLDLRYCEKKGWQTPRLLLALPSTFEAKANVRLHTYPGPMKTVPMYDWIRERLDGMVEKISSRERFLEEWHMYKDPFLNPEVRTVLFTNQRNFPMFYSALSVKFPGRIKFGVVDVTSSGGKSIVKYLTTKNGTKVTVPSYLIRTAESASFYGNKKGESFSYIAMEIYFRTLYPCLNDIFILTFIITNLSSIFQLCLIQGTLFRRVKKFIWYLIKCNIVLIMLWLPIVGLFQLPYLDKFPLWLLKGLRLFSTTNLAAFLRKDISYYSMHSATAAMAFVGFAFLVGFIEYRRKLGMEAIDDEEENYWNFTEMRTLEHLIRPSGFRLVPPSSIGLLGNRFMPADLPEHFISYVADLPRWRYASLQTDIYDDAVFSCAICKCSQSSTCQATDLLETSVSNFTSMDSIHPNVSTSANLVPDTDSLQSLVDDAVSCIDRRASPCHPVKSVTSRGAPEQPSIEVKSCSCSSTSSQAPEPFDVKFPEGFLATNQCVICLDDYCHGTVLCGLPCGHTFHEACVVTWLKRSNHYCPVCRWPAFQSKSCQVHMHSE